MSLECELPRSNHYSARSRYKSSAQSVDYVLPEPRSADRAPHHWKDSFPFTSESTRYNTSYNTGKGEGGHSLTLEGRLFRSARTSCSEDDAPLRETAEQCLHQKVCKVHTSFSTGEKVTFSVINICCSSHQLRKVKILRITLLPSLEPIFIYRISMTAQCLHYIIWISFVFVFVILWSGFFLRDGRTRRASKVL